MWLLRKVSAIQMLCFNWYSKIICIHHALLVTDSPLHARVQVPWLLVVDSSDKKYLRYCYSLLTAVVTRARFSIVSSLRLLPCVLITALLESYVPQVSKVVNIAS